MSYFRLQTKIGYDHEIISDICDIQSTGIWKIESWFW